MHVASERTRGDAAVFAILLRVVLRDGDEERGERKTSMSDVSSGISSSSGSDGREVYGHRAWVSGGVRRRWRGGGEVPYGSQMPRDVLEANGATEAPRRTSASRVREIREEMARGKAAFLNARGKNR